MLSLSPVVTHCIAIQVFLCCSSFRKSSFVGLPEVLVEFNLTNEIHLIDADWLSAHKPFGLSHFVRTNILASQLVHATYVIANVNTAKLSGWWLTDIFFDWRHFDSSSFFLLQKILPISIPWKNVKLLIGKMKKDCSNGISLGFPTNEPVCNIRDG